MQCGREDEKVSRFATTAYVDHRVARGAIYKSKKKTYGSRDIPY